ncbi:MAG TPA: folate-binding protein [Actinomycetota bacterium]|nr:folate-binding protein [Actinomycetota bacterium]
MDQPRLADALAAARAGVVAVERTDLATLALSGADVLRYLHTVSTQHTAGLAPGDAAEALLLSPKGKIEFAFRLAVLDPERLPGRERRGVLLDTQAEAAAALAERLARFVFRYDVAVGTPGAGALSLLGPEADAALAAAGLPVPPAAPGRAAVGGPALVAHRTPAGVDVVGGAAPAALHALADAGVPAAPLAAWEALRVEHGLPRWGQELTDDVIAEEAGLLGSHVHLDKGCYPGQETVARVHNLGQVQRRLAGLVFEGDELPPPRADLVTDDGRRAGQVRTAVRHPDLGPVALAYVRRVVPAGRLVLAGPLVARVVDLPFTLARIA